MDFRYFKKLLIMAGNDRREIAKSLGIRPQTISQALWEEKPLKSAMCTKLEKIVIKKVKNQAQK